MMYCRMFFQSQNISTVYGLAFFSFQISAFFSVNNLFPFTSTVEDLIDRVQCVVMYFFLSACPVPCSTVQYKPGSRTQPFYSVVYSPIFMIRVACSVVH